jgi:murein DD-endopeptidase MepM/ murein hydrolase activator NlpD
MAARCWRIPLVWHGSASVSRIVEVSGDAVRAVVSLGVLAFAVLLLVGTAAVTGRPADEATQTVLRASSASFAALPDSMVLLRQNRPAGPDPFGTLLWSFRPAGLLAGSFRQATESLTANVRRLASTPSIMPTQGWLSSQFSPRRVHPMLGVSRPHKGIDVRAPMGTPIEAPAAGMISKAGWESDYGWTIEIDHGYGISTRYAHTSRMLVRAGRRVERGELIARVGRTGLADGPHLHYEVHVNGRPVDPLKFVLPSVLAD